MNIVNNKHIKYKINFNWYDISLIHNGIYSNIINKQNIQVFKDKGVYIFIISYKSSKTSMNININDLESKCIIFDFLNYNLLNYIIRYKNKYQSLYCGRVISC